MIASAVFGRCSFRRRAGLAEQPRHVHRDRVGDEGFTVQGASRVAPVRECVAMRLGFFMIRLVRVSLGPLPLRAELGFG
jgi:hypothetical protein